MGALYHLTDS